MEEKEIEIDSVELNEGEAKVVKRPWLRRLWRITWITALTLLGIALLMPIVYKWVNPPLTPLMVQRFFQQLTEKGREVNFERDYVSIDDISPNLVSAVVSSEDGRFMRHKGFRRIRGGSTISMQTAKNAFLPHRRSYVRKALEAGYTMAIEKL